MTQVWTAAMAILVLELMRRRSTYKWTYCRLARYSKLNLMTRKCLLTLEVNVLPSFKFLKLRSVIILTSIQMVNAKVLFNFSKEHTLVLLFISNSNTLYHNEKQTTSLE